MKTLFLALAVFTLNTTHSYAGDGAVLGTIFGVPLTATASEFSSGNAKQSKETEEIREEVKAEVEANEQ